ncbi:MAG: NADPH-dependent glutamate synthase [Thermoguttaceae bacterium]|nr:NADPH-dependent glutamate synthase [Thermoguttaceae bacterium]MDW8036488.1 NADPH-dependent glutamate synthase [Thermoguttaceae bacterium]
MHSSSGEEHQQKKIIGQRVPMPEQSPEERIHNFLEVPLGYSPEQAQAEARRCLQCKKPLCVQGCPVHVDIPGFIGRIAAGEFAAAAQRIKQTNFLPAICGRVCPQETMCESKCILGQKYEPIAIGALERFAADYVREHGLIQPLPPEPPTGKKVAIIGSGPAGLTAAGYLARWGHETVVFEAFHTPGGVLVYGIPEFRLPKRIVDAEVDQLRQMGVRFELNQVIGKTITIDELLQEGFDAIFIGVGAGLPRFMQIPGENLAGVYSANEYLTRSNLMKAFAFPAYHTPIVRGRNVCVVGGGNVAMDAARTARRLGAETVTVLYRRSRQEMPARAAEIHHAEQEGIQFRFLCAPVEYLGDLSGKVCQVVCQQMELGPPDNSGRRQPIPIPGALFSLPADLVIVAIGAEAHPLLTKQTPGLQLTSRGYIVTDERGRTSRRPIWAGGDIVTGSATVISAMGAGKIAAQDIHQYLANPLQPWTISSEIAIQL